MFEAFVIGLHLATAHVDPVGGFNSVNPGIYARAPSGWAGGAYYNSVRKPSVWFGHVFESRDKRYALTLGGVTGYHYMKGPAFCPRGAKLLPGEFCYETGPKVSPLIVPSVRVALGHSTALRVSYLMGSMKHAHGLHFSVEFQ